MTDTSKSAAYSTGTFSSLLQGEGIPDEPIRIQSSRQQFRPDIEGMRAIAVGMVILFHAYHKPFTGGFVGVDAFVILPDFSITSLLLKELKRAGRISIAGFYAGCVRRILPASTVVVVITLFATYYWLGFISGNDVANDAKWTAVFAANIHFGLVRTDYFGAQLPPSPLQHMWSLGVEEQFYLLWPGVFLVLVLLARGAQHRKALAGALSLIIAASLIWSVVQTAVNQTWVYFSPLDTGLGVGLGSARRGLGANHRATPACVDATRSCFCRVGRNRRRRSAFHFGQSLPRICSNASSGGQCSTNCGWVRQPTHDRWACPVGVANAAGRPPGPTRCIFGIGHCLSSPPENATRALSAFQNTGWVLRTVVASAITYRLVENPSGEPKYSRLALV